MASIEQQLKNLEKTLLTGKDAKQILEREANRLKAILDKWIQAYYDSYTPTQYKRTYKFLNSVRVGVVKEELGRLVVNVEFNDDMVTRDEAYLPLLLDKGWNQEDRSGAYHFDWYLGFHFIRKAINEYNKTNNLGVKVTAYLNGKEYTN